MPISAAMTPTPTPTPTQTPVIVSEAEPLTGQWFIDWFIGAPLRVLTLIVIGVVVRAVVVRLIDRIVAKSEVTEQRFLGSRRIASAIRGSAAQEGRRALRARTLGSLLKSIATAAIFTITALMVMGEFYDIGPLIASAGIVGVALGFGAQNLVKDFISGVFMLLEDQFGVGDVIDMGEAIGVVEHVGLRVTRIRALDGTLWHVRNGEVLRVGNMSQGWGRVVLDVSVAYDEDTTRVETLLLQVCTEFADDPDWAEAVVEDPVLAGVESLGREAVVVRAMVKVTADKKADALRALRARVKERFDAEGVRFPETTRSLVPPPRPTV